MKAAGSPDDPLPPRLFKEVFETIAPVVLTLLNNSLTSSVVPVHFKQAVVHPLLKKPGLDSSILSNFRPISKLPFISKILETIVFIQLRFFLDEHNILETFQSGFKSGHSTETALLRVFNDIFISTDAGHSTVLVLLDLTAAFDTVDHEILLSRLEHWVGIRGSALHWFRSYLADRHFCVSLGDFVSSLAPLTSGVPQGSILGPLLFSLYMLPLGLILRKHGVGFHFYADDTQIYLPLKKCDSRAAASLLDCLEDLKLWMSLNFLKLNQEKSEVIVFSPSSPGHAPSVDLGILNHFMKQVVTNVGVTMDLKLDQQISKVVKSSFFQLRKLAKIKPILTQQHFETVMLS
uniref:Reverse transcriptase domain-containing protein n=1 Tax=Neogobius melanostomus TaxID=47308 RepID=A0A8C6V627_9GOBI